MTTEKFTETVSTPLGLFRKAKRIKGDAETCAEDVVPLDPDGFGGEISVPAPGAKRTKPKYSGKYNAQSSGKQEKKHCGGGKKTPAAVKNGRRNDKDDESLHMEREKMIRNKKLAEVIASFYGTYVKNKTDAFVMGDALSNLAMKLKLAAINEPLAALNGQTIEEIADRYRKFPAEADIRFAFVLAMDVYDATVSKIENWDVMRKFLLSDAGKMEKAEPMLPKDA